MNLLKQFKMMFLSHLKMTFREKQAWFWSIFFPVILMVIFMLIWGGGNNDEFSAEIAIVNESPDQESEVLEEQLKAIPVFNIDTEENLTEAKAEELVKDKEVDGAVILPDSVENEIKLLVNKENEESVTSQAILGILNNFIQQANIAIAGAEPVYKMDVAFVSAGNRDFEFNDFILTGMIALGIAQSGLFGMAAQVEMRKKGVIKRLRMTPANMNLFGLSDMLMRILFGIIQVTLLVIIGIFIFKATLHVHFPSLIVIFLAGAVAFNAIGYFLSALSKTMEAYMGMANIFNFLMMFLSGIMFPIDTIPSWLHPISHILPLTYFAEGIRGSMLYAEKAASVSFWQGIAVIMLWGLITFVIGSFLYRRKAILETR